MKFRHAKSNDFLAICTLLADFCAESGTPFDSASLAVLTANSLRDPDKVTLLVEVDGVVVAIFLGMLCTSVFDGHAFAQDRVLYVHPDFRNKEVTYGLYKEFLNWAKEKSCTEVLFCVLCSKDNDRLTKVLEWLKCKTAGYFLKKKL